MKDKILKLKGKVQHYPWGGYDFIPSLLNVENTAHKPFAEYWLGAHPSASSEIETKEGWEPWFDLLKQAPEEHLGSKVWGRFGELPYLLKVLDVREMLSIQVHPSKEEAVKGFEREESEGVDIAASHRNYKDKNHKPEVMVALDDFWLLHGFKKKEQLQEVLASVPEFAFLKNVFAEEGYYGLYKLVMSMPQAEVDKALLPLIEREICSCDSKEQPGYWVGKLYHHKAPAGNVDRGIFSIYFFNLVHLKHGEAIFQAAGVPHAYLEGQNVELMANSDNVLRGGLTPKHIDVQELLKHTRFEGIEPEILRGNIEEHEKDYCVPVEDFGMCTITLDNGREYVRKSKSAEIFLVMQGEVNCGDVMCKRGEAFTVLADTDYTMRAVEDAVVFRAYVPVD